MMRKLSTLHAALLLLLAAVLTTLLHIGTSDAGTISASQIMTYSDGDAQPKLSLPLLEILHPENDMLLSKTELQIDVAVRDEIPGGFVNAKLCISMDPVAIPADVELEDGRSQLRETCFDHTVNGTTFHVEGLVPGLTYAITAGLITHARVLSISMRTFAVASIRLPALGLERMGIARALEAGAELHNAGLRQRASQIYRAVLALFPEHPQALHMLGLVFYQDGDVVTGHAYIRRALALNASDDAFHNSLGLCLKAMGRARDAVQAYRRALELRPFFFEAALNLGDALQALDQYDDAMHEYRKVAASATQSGADAIARDAWSRVCELVRVTDGPKDCNVCLTESIKRWPDEPTFRNERGVLLVGAQQLEAAMTEFQHAADLGSIIGMINVAETLEALGETEECLHQYQLISMAMNPEHGHPETRVRIMRATVLPMIVPRDDALLTFYRERFESQIDELQANIATLRRTEMDPSLISFSTALTLNAHNRNNRVLRTKLAALYTDLLQRHRVVRENYVLTHMMIPLQYRLVLRLPTDPPAIAQRRLRIGFVSRFLVQARAGLFVSDLLPRVSRVKYETFAFVIGLSTSMKRKDKVEQIASQVCALPNDLVTARDEILAANIDVLVFPEIGIDRLTYFLSLSRLAPVQAVWWGNPDTSGVATIDYRLVSEYEHASYHEHYSETTYQFKGLGLYHSFPEPHDYTVSRDQVRGAIIDRFDLPSDFRMYLSLESILHLHPDFDRAVGLILQQDDRARIFLLGRSTRNRWRDQLVARIYANVGADNVDGRIFFLNDVDAKQELLLAGAADAVLASIHVTSARPTIQAFTAGVPVVTLRGTLWGSRVAFALYEQMGMSDMVVTTVEAYAALAVRLASDHAFRREMVETIQARRAQLHEDPRAVDEWEKFFDFAGATIYPTDDDVGDSVGDSVDDDVDDDVDVSVDDSSSNSDSNDLEVDTTSSSSNSERDAVESTAAEEDDVTPTELETTDDSSDDDSSPSASSARDEL